MNEEEIKYGEWMIYPVKLYRGQCWGVRVKHLPMSGSGFGGADAGEDVPGEFSSKETAIQVGKDYINRVNKQ